MIIEFSNKNDYFISKYQNLVFGTFENRQTFNDLLKEILMNNNINDDDKIKLYYLNLIEETIPMLFKLKKIKSIKQLIDKMFLSEIFISTKSINKVKWYTNMNKLLNEYEKIHNNPYYDKNNNIIIKNDYYNDGCCGGTLTGCDNEYEKINTTKIKNNTNINMEPHNPPSLLSFKS